METFFSSNSMPWIIIISALIICILALFSKVIKISLKLAVIGVMLLFIIYFLRQAGIL